MKEGAGSAEVVDIQNVCNKYDMKKYSHRCPFCKGNIPKIYTERTVTVRKRRKTRVKVIKDVIGEDWATHVQTCQELKEFLNKTK